MNILLKSATIIDPESPYHRSCKDVLIEKGKIARISDNIEAASGMKVISLPDLHLSKGWFDSSVSFGEPGFEERETLENGALTAARSGFTDVALLPALNPVTDTGSQVAYLCERTKNFATKIYPVGALTVGHQGTALAELFDMKRNGALYFLDAHTGTDNPLLLKLALQYAQGFEGIISSFPTDTKLQHQGMMHEGEFSTQLGLNGIATIAETTRIARDLHILGYTGGRLHIPTLSCAASVELIRNAKKAGLHVTCSVNILHLALHDTDVEDFNTDRKILPPLREPADSAALLEGLKDGTIDMVTTDHRPMDIEHKKVEFDWAAFGSINLESGFGLLNKVLPLEWSIERLTSGAKCFGIVQPTIKEGEEARLTLFNPNLEYTFSTNDVLSANSNAAALGKKLKGKAYGIVAAGKLELGS